MGSLDASALEYIIEPNRRLLKSSEDAFRIMYRLLYHALFAGAIFASLRHKALNDDQGKSVILADFYRIATTTLGKVLRRTT